MTFPWAEALSLGQGYLHAHKAKLLALWDQPGIWWDWRSSTIALLGNISEIIFMFDEIYVIFISSGALHKISLSYVWSSLAVFLCTQYVFLQTIKLLCPICGFHYTLAAMQKPLVCFYNWTACPFSSFPPRSKLAFWSISIPQSSGCVLGLLDMLGSWG